MTTLTGTYVIYLTLSILIAVYVTQTLHWHGRPFLRDVFDGQTGLADAVNQLLVVGCYLTNVAFIALTLKTGLAVATPQEAVDLLSTKLGILLLVLGVMHFGNMLVLSQIRAWKRLRRESR